MNSEVFFWPCTAGQEGFGSQEGLRFRKTTWDQWVIVPGSNQFGSKCFITQISIVWAVAYQHYIGLRVFCCCCCFHVQFSQDLSLPGAIFEPGSWKQDEPVWVQVSFSHLWKEQSRALGISLASLSCINLPCKYLIFNQIIMWQEAKHVKDKQIVQM